MQMAVFAVLTLNTLDEVRTLLADRESQALRDLDDCLAGLAAYGLSECITFDISVIRGLAYYTGIVFEAFDVAGKFRAVFGGGRYDNLLASVGGRPQTGVGVGFGDVVVAELLADRGLLAAAGARSRVTVGYMAPEQQTAAVKVATMLRAEGEQVDLALHAEKPRAFFSRADKRAFARGVYIGPDDVASGKVRIKDLVTREETVLALD